MVALTVSKQNTSTPELMRYHDRFATGRQGFKPITTGHSFDILSDQTSSGGDASVSVLRTRYIAYSNRSLSYGCICCTQR